MTKIAVAESHHKYLTETIALKDQIEEGFLVLAERLKKIRDENLYSAEYDSFEEFLMELRVSRSTAYKIIGVYEKFVLLGEIDRGEVALRGWGNLCLFLGFIHSKEDARKIFDKVAPLARTDALREMTELKTGKPMANCAHDFQEIHLRQCQICQLKERIYDNE